MVTRRLLLVLVVLLQSGLMAHAHVHAGGAPHAHADDLLAPFAPGTPDEPAPDRDHDADAVYLDALTAGPTVPTAAVVAADLTSELPVLLTSASSANMFLLGLPPPTAGPPRPLYLSHCALRN